MFGTKIITLPDVILNIFRGNIWDNYIINIVWTGKMSIPVNLGKLYIYNVIPRQPLKKIIKRNSNMLRIHKNGILKNIQVTHRTEGKRTQK